MAEEETRPEPCEGELTENLEILKQHEKWVNSEGREGQRANLAGCDLRGISLSEANLRGVVLKAANLENTDLSYANFEEAILCEANLKGAYLESAEFQKADLTRAQFQTDATEKESRSLELNWTNFEEATLGEVDLHGATFYKTRFQDADLTDANLTGGTRLSSQQLAGADVSGAKLPEDIARFDSLKQADEASQSTKRIFLAMLLACAYSALTIFSTTDAQLLPNSASSPLPIIGTSIPIAGFFGVAPAILLAIFFYFHLYLQDLWGKLSQLPAVFPDGTSLDQRVFPWLLNGLVQRYLPRLKPYRTAMYPLRVFVASLLAWWIVPLTIALFWIRYLVRHDWLVTGFHLGFLVVAVVFAVWSQGLAKRTVRMHTTRPQTTWPKRGGLAALSLVSVLTVLAVSEGALQWEELDDYRSIEFHRNVVPTALPFVGASANADVSEQDVSTKPENWFLVAPSERIDSTIGAQLVGLDLRNLEARDAFLVKADLREANLRGANLEAANLQQAEFREANLQEATLRKANLQEANLERADLQKAHLGGVHLQGANLEEADLQEAFLGGVNLQRANLRQADLRRTDLKGANLEGAKLELADLREIDLRQAKLQNANLSEADLRWADLKGVQGWEAVSNIELANVYSVKNAPDRFMRWAVNNRAVCLGPDRTDVIENKWEELRLKDNRTEEDFREAQKDCFVDRGESQTSTSR